MSICICLVVPFVNFLCVASLLCQSWPPPISMLAYVPSISDVISQTEECFGVTPHLFQVEDTLAQLKRQDVITISPTGSGKTLTFWMPLLFNNNGIKIVVTSLNLLGDQNVTQLEELGIKAVNLTKTTSTNEVFKVVSGSPVHATAKRLQTGPIWTGPPVAGCVRFRLKDRSCATSCNRF